MSVIEQISATDPTQLQVGVEIGSTINLGNYESLRLGVFVSANNKLTDKDVTRIKNRVRKLINIADSIMSNEIGEIGSVIPFAKNSAFRFAVSSERKGGE